MVDDPGDQVSGGIGVQGFFRVGLVVHPHRGHGSGLGQQRDQRGLVGGSQLAGDRVHAAGSLGRRFGDGFGHVVKPRIRRGDGLPVRRGFLTAFAAGRRARDGVVGSLERDVAGGRCGLPN